jgi:predicted transcriptional regulator
MHVHATHDTLVRTTIELSHEHRERLLELAARRGEKGFSSIVEEALGRYFVREDRRREAVDRALAALGSFSPEEADRLEEEVERLRRSWR